MQPKCYQLKLSATVIWDVTPWTSSVRPIPALPEDPSIINTKFQLFTRLENNLLKEFFKEIFIYFQGPIQHPGTSYQLEIPSDYLDLHLTELRKQFFLFTAGHMILVILGLRHLSERF